MSAQRKKPGRPRTAKPYKNITVRLWDLLHTRVELEARRRKVSRGRVVEDALKIYFYEQDALMQQTQEAERLL